MSTNDAIAALEKASQGLLYQSESDEPFVSFVWKKAEGELNAAAVLKRAKKPAKTPVQEVALADFFKGLTKEEDWYEAEEKAAAAKYRSLQQMVTKTLTDAKVFKVGKTKVSVYIVGKTDEGDWAGLKTTAVET
jgi:hypothetical protein